MKTRSRTSHVWLGLALSVCCVGAAEAQETHVHDDGTVHVHDGLHFTHPLIAESITPDRKVRFDYQHFAFPDGDNEDSGVLEGEWAFHRSFSIEAGLPYSFTASEFGNLEVLFKFANYAFEEAGLLLGYGLEVGIPTNGTPDGEAGDAGATRLRASSVDARLGRPPPAPRFSSSGGGGGVESTLGTDEWELAPFLNLGWKKGGMELVGWAFFGIPVGGERQEGDVGGTPPAAAEEGEGVELGYNLSALYSFSSRFQTVLELDGSGGLTGGSVGEDNLNLSPGIRFRPFARQPLVLGVSAGFPLTNEAFFDARIKAAAFWHF